MKVVLPPTVVDQLLEALHLAGRRETGGVLVGEHLQDDTFRVAALSVQPSGGSEHRFVRDPVHHATFLATFFDQTAHDYTRHNYLGEWHSHPSAPAVPSPTDCDTMDQLVRDPKVGVNFAVLMIARLASRKRIQMSITAFSPNDAAIPATPVAEAPNDEERIVPVDRRTKRIWIRLV